METLIQNDEQLLQEEQNWSNAGLVIIPRSAHTQESFIELCKTEEVYALDLDDESDYLLTDDHDLEGNWNSYDRIFFEDK